MNAAIREGILLFNGQKFFEAHEALEALWLRAEGEEKILLHGLIQIAAAFHHHTRGNTQGFRSLLEKGSRKLARFQTAGMGIDVAELFRQLEPWRTRWEASQSSARPLPPLPRITITAARSSHS
jgi:predicted metal-dependent hydrolase